MLTLACYPYDLKFIEVFAVSKNARTTTEVLFVEITYQNHTGYGEASFPPYMAERREDNLQFLSSVNLAQFSSPFAIQDIQEYLNSLSQKHNPAKAAIDMALHDLMGKITGQPVYKLLGLETQKTIHTSYTIGLGDDAFLERQLEKSKAFSILKIKLGGDVERNKETITFIQQHTRKDIGVDFNEGLKDRETALEMIEWLAARGILYAEQPLPDAQREDYLWLKGRSPLDIYGDESIQNWGDILEKRHLFHGINIKLMKCGGIRNAMQMAVLAKNLRLKTMLGCMAESSCAVTAAAHLSPLFDKVDLDGNLLIANNLFTGIDASNGIIQLLNTPGLGVNKLL